MHPTWAAAYSSARCASPSVRSLTRRDCSRRRCRSSPFNATAAYGLAVALTRGGDRDRGEKAMARFQLLRDNPAAITYSTTYLEQGRYGEALASTGLEPELIDTGCPKR